MGVPELMKKPSWIFPGVNDLRGKKFGLIAVIPNLKKGGGYEGLSNFKPSKTVSQ